MRVHLRLALAALCTLSIATPALVQAQDAKKAVKLTDDQLNLNNKAVDALEKSPPDTKTAITLMQAALSIGGEAGKADLLYMTLGRAYELQDKCEEAKRYFTMAEEAPRVEGLPSGLVPERLVKYRLEMKKVCSGTLVVKCNDPRIALSIGDAQHKCDAPIKLAPGQYKVEAKLQEDERKSEQSIDVTIEGAQRTSAAVSLVLQKPTTTIIQNPNDGKVTKPVRYKKNTTPAVIAGVTTVVVSAALWGWWIYADGQADDLEDQLLNDNLQGREYDQTLNDYNSADGQAAIALPLAGAATGVGIIATVLLYQFAGNEPDPTAASAQPYIMTGPGQAGAGVTIKW